MKFLQITRFSFYLVRVTSWNSPSRSRLGVLLWPSLAARDSSTESQTGVQNHPRTSGRKDTSEIFRIIFLKDYRCNQVSLDSVDKFDESVKRIQVSHVAVFHGLCASDPFDLGFQSRSPAADKRTAADCASQRRQRSFLVRRRQRGSPTEITSVQLVERSEVE